MIAAKRAAEARVRNSITLRDGKLRNEPPPPAPPPADLTEIERVIRVGMCSPSKLAEGGCECCEAKLAAVEAVRALHERIADAERERDELRRWLLDLLARIHRDGGHYTERFGLRASVHDADHVVATAAVERDDLRAEVERLRRPLHALEAIRGARAERDTLRAEVERLRAERVVVADTDTLVRTAAEQVETIARLTRERDEAREALDALATTLDEADGWHPVMPPARLVATVERLWRNALSREHNARAEVERLMRRIAHDNDGNTLDAIRAALGPHATDDLAADVRRLVERTSIAEANQQISADVNAALLSEIGASHIDEAVVVLHRERQRAAVLRTYLARALRGCDPRERRAIEADLASEEREEVSDG